MYHSMCPACGGNSHVKIEDCAFCGPRVGKPEEKSVGEKELLVWCMPDCECPECIMDKTRHESTIVAMFVCLLASLVLEGFGERTKASAQYDNTHRQNELESATRDSHQAEVNLAKQDLQQASVTTR